MIEDSIEGRSFQFYWLLGIICVAYAKSNAVFYRLPKASEQRSEAGGTKAKIWLSISLSRMRFSQQLIEGQLLSVAQTICRTKRCSELVRLVVVRTKPKQSKPYRYFVVITYDLSLGIQIVLKYYRLRWELETAFRDAKQHFGFDAYQVKSEKSQNRFVQLSFVAASITQWLFIKSPKTEPPVDVEAILDTLGIHWYHPAKLTRGVMIAYLRDCHLLAIKAWAAISPKML